MLMNRRAQPWDPSSGVPTSTHHALGDINSSHDVGEGQYLGEVSHLGSGASKIKQGLFACMLQCTVRCILYLQPCDDSHDQ